MGQPAWTHPRGQIHLFQRKKSIRKPAVRQRTLIPTPVLIPFPQPNIWTIAFVSGEVPQAIAEALPEQTDYVSVYVPTTPNPTGGYYIMVRRSDIRQFNMSVDEALKYVISLGMVMPNDPHVIAQPEKAEAKES